jgi:hypothetical protein
MFHSEAVAAGGLTFRLDAGMDRIGPAAPSLTQGTVSGNAIRAQQKEALRRRLVEVILRNEQLRKLKPR